MTRLSLCRLPLSYSPKMCRQYLRRCSLGKYKRPVLTVDRCSFKLGNSLLLELMHLNRGDCLVASLNVTDGGNKESALRSALKKAPEIHKFLFDSIESAKQLGMSGLKLESYYQVANFDPHAAGSFKIPGNILVVSCDDCKPEQSDPVVEYRDGNDVSDECLAQVHLWYEKNLHRKTSGTKEDSGIPEKPAKALATDDNQQVQPKHIIAIKDKVAADEGAVLSFGIILLKKDDVEVNGINSVISGIGNKFANICYKWMNTEGSDATFGELCSALKVIGMDKKAKKIWSEMS
eukprot:m.281456 g.281456  ORF g.281456 m.281456 type:complete len:291 (+) comp40646_c0_seq8:264-1136(+)